VSLNPGDLIQEKYRITRLIGQGGMGAVYEGENVVIARRVAIKVLHGMMAADGSTVERFEREAQAAGRIGNDHILEVLDMGRLGNNNDRFMVMEYLDGETLDARCERFGRLTDADLYAILRQLLTGLAAAHAAGIVHRDLKPDNIFILQHKAGQKDFVKIIDFGISKFTAGGANFKMTMTGAIMGTPYYMAPEQAKGGKNVDMRSDVYAVGVVMFKALTGQVPFQAESFNELIFKIALSETPHLSSILPDIDPELDAIVFKAMARNLEDRYQSALQLRDALDVWGEARGFSSLGITRGSQVGLEREVGNRLTGQRGSNSDVHGETVTALQDATHAPWSNTGNRTNPGKGRTWGIAIGAFVAVGAIAAMILAGGDDDPTTPQLPTPATGSTLLQPAPSPQPVLEVKTSEPKPEVKLAPTTPEPATSAAKVETTDASETQKATPTESPRPAPRPVPRPITRPTPAPVVRPAPAPSPTPKPQVKPVPKPRPADLLGY
jgi:eukaryotic-like serine/threonine-protein kinase